MQLQKIFVFLLIAVAVISCNSSYQQKPKGYTAIKFPAERKYTSFNDPKYPYSFEYPTYANIVKDSTFFDASPKNDYWVNVDFGSYNCKIYLSYSSVKGDSHYKIKNSAGQYVDSVGKNSFDKLREDAFALSAKHIYKADKAPSEKFVSTKGITGIIFKVGGNAASPVQFFMTDTTTHFLRGALYYEASPNSDSTKPITEFLYKDLQHMMNTLEWRKQ
jgi:hypothetical protein